MEIRRYTEPPGDEIQQWENLGNSVIHAHSDVGQHKQQCEKCQHC